MPRTTGNAEGVGHVEGEDADGLGAAAAQGAGMDVGVIAERSAMVRMRSTGGLGDVAGERGPR